MSVSRRSGAAWSILDQGLSSATNLLAVVVAARLLAPSAFGKFTIVYGICVVALGLAQAFVSQPLVLTTGDGEAKQRACRSAVGLAAIVGLGIATALALLAVLLPALRSGMLVAAVLMPLVVLQDCTRFACSVLGRMNVACLSDLTWLVGVCVGAVAMRGSASWPAVLALWAGAGALAAVPGLWSVLLRLTRGMGSPVRQFGKRAYLGYRFSWEFLAVRGANQLMVISTGWLLSAESAGALRGVQTLFGPVNVAVQALSLFGAPLLVGATFAHRTKVLAAMAAVLALAGVVVTGTLLLIPAAVGRQLLGETWSLASSQLILALGLQASAVGVFTAALLGLRLEAPRRTLPVQLVTTMVFVVLFCAGVAVFELNGAAWAFGVGTVAADAIAMWAYLRARGTRDRDVVSARSAVAVSDDRPLG